MRGVGEEIGRTTRGGGWRWLSLRGEKNFNLLGCLKKKRKRKVIYRLGCRYAKNGLTDLHSRKKEEKEKEKNGSLLRRGIPLQTLDFSFTALRRYAPGRRRQSREVSSAREAACSPQPCLRFCAYMGDPLRGLAMKNRVLTTRPYQ